MTKILNTGTPLDRPMVKIEGHYTFLVIFVVGMLFFLSLAIWQWHRGIEKEQLLKAYSLRQTAPPVTLEDILHAKNFFDLLYHRVSLKGHFDEHRSLLLDNQFHHHRIGYSVFTPFMIAPSQAILVYRGWVKISPDRSILPEIVAPSGEVKLMGTLWRGESSRFHFGNELTLPEKWPKRIQVLQWEALPFFPYRVLPIGLWQDASGETPDELPRVPLRITTISPERHYGYAVIWGIIAIVFSVLCGYLYRVQIKLT